MTDQRPDQEMDDQVAEWLADTGLRPGEAEPGLHRLLMTFPTTPQTRRRFLGRWLDRDGGARRRADMHDHPTERSRRNRLMFSATALTAAIAVLALGANIASTQPELPDAATGATYTVGTDGLADFRSIANAVRAADDGDTILVGPGTYTESILVDKDVNIAGDGSSAADVIVRIPEDGPTVPWFQFDLRHAFHLLDSDARISNLSVTGPNNAVSAFVIRGGSPTVDGTTVDIDPASRTSARGLAYIGGGSTATLSNNVSDGFVWVAEGAAPVIVGNRLLVGGATELGFRVDGEGTRATIEDNTAYMVVVHNGASALVANNDLSFHDGVAGGTSCGIELYATGPGVEIRGNRIHETNWGICATRVPSAVVSGNELTGNAFAGISLTESNVELSQNVIDGSPVGVSTNGGSVALLGNTVTNGKTGVLVMSDSASLVMRDNTICDNERNVSASAGVDLPDLAENEVCEDEPAA